MTWNRKCSLCKKVEESDDFASLYREEHNGPDLGWVDLRFEKFHWLVGHLFSYLLAMQDGGAYKL